MYLLLTRTTRTTMMQEAEPATGSYLIAALVQVVANHTRRLPLALAQSEAAKVVIQEFSGSPAMRRNL